MTTTTATATITAIATTASATTTCILPTFFRICVQVTYGRAAICFSEWFSYPGRDTHLDFAATTTTSNLVLVLRPQPPRVDMDLFVRPFTRDSWIALGFMSAVLLTGTALPFLLFPGYFSKDGSSNSSGYRIVNLSAMGFLILIDAFYGGAMTMFFSTEITIPLNSLRDVLRDDTWMLIIHKGKIVTTNSLLLV